MVFVTILITSPCSKSAVEELEIKTLPLSTYDIGSFDWPLNNKETCFLIEHKVRVTQKRRGVGLLNFGLATL